DSKRVPEPVRKASGIEKREPWVKGRIQGSPEPPNPFVMTKVSPGLKCFEALEIVAMPGKNAWVVAERPGKVFTFGMDPAKAQKKEVLDVKHTVYGAALHPKFQDN